MKIRMMIATLGVSAALLTGCAGQVVTAAEPIGLDAAKAAALEDAGLSAADVSFTTTGLDRRGDTEYYAVDFTAGGETYAYDIDAATGVVIAREVPAQAEAAGTQTAETGTAGAQTAAEAGNSGTQTVAGTQTAQSVQSAQGTTQSGGSLIGEAAAKTAALTHAGVKESAANFLRCKLDWEDGRQVYEVEFYTDSYQEYDYEVDALTGEIVSYDYDAETWSQPAASGGELTAAQAKALALAQVPGATEADIWDFETDIDDGRLEYEGEIRYNGMEYDFEIDGYSGTIRSWEAEAIGH